MADKFMTTLNGYEIRDAYAREKLEELLSGGGNIELEEGTDEDALRLLMEVGMVDPVSVDGTTLLTNNDGKVYIL